MVKGVAVLSSSAGVTGTIYFNQEGEGPTTVTGNLAGLSPGLHGFHVHALGDTTNGCLYTDIIQKLMDCGRPFDAIRLVFAFELPDRFPPVPILRAYLHLTFFESKEFCSAGGLP
ncbi:Superoxide dismutase [Cu-Zn]-like protein [Drosera capensis]